MAKTNEFKTTVYLGTVNGKEIKKTVRAKSKRELDKKVEKIKYENRQGKDVYTRAYFGVWADKWLNEIKVPSGIGKKTLEEYESAIKHLKRSYEFVEIKDIKLSDFQVFINELAQKNPNTKKPASKKLLKDVIAVAKGVFEYAIGNNIAGVTNFFSSIKIPKNAVVTKRRSLTEKEQQWILETEHRAKLAAMIMMFSGLRRGELIALEWNDIDFEKKTIRVNKSIEFEENSGSIKDGGKTINAKRTVPIPSVLVDYLQEYKKTVDNKNKNVCLSATGKIHTKSSWRKLWDSYIVDLNIRYGYNNEVNKHNPKIKSSDLPLKIDRLTAHYLRHTFATMLYLQGVDVVTAKQILGHADIQTTVNIYTDLENFNKSDLSDKYKENLKTIYAIKWK